MKTTKKGERAQVEVKEPERVRLADVNLAPYNPRTISREEMRSLKASIAKHGLVLTLVVQRAGMTLIGGHQRLRALRELCEERGQPVPEHAWAVVLDVDDSTAKQLNVALNRIGGEFDPYKLGELFSSIQGQMVPDDFVAVGFEPAQVDELVAGILPIDLQAGALEAGIGDLGAFAKSITLTVEFDTVEARDDAKEKLGERARAAKVKAGAIVAQLLAATKPEAKGIPAKAAKGKPEKKAK